MKRSILQEKRENSKDSALFVRYRRKGRSQFVGVPTAKQACTWNPVSDYLTCKLTTKLTVTPEALMQCCSSHKALLCMRRYFDWSGVIYRCYVLYTSVTYMYSLQVSINCYLQVLYIIFRYYYVPWYNVR